MTYHFRDAMVLDVCYDCGEPATIVLVADEAEHETGYIDEVPLCEECAERRGV